MVQQENDMLRGGGGAGRHLGPPSRAGTPGALGGNGRQPMSPHSLGGNMVRATTLVRGGFPAIFGHHFFLW